MDLIVQFDSHYDHIRKLSQMPILAMNDQNENEDMETLRLWLPEKRCIKNVRVRNNERTQNNRGSTHAPLLTKQAEETELEDI